MINRIPVIVMALTLVCCGQSIIYVHKDEKSSPCPSIIDRAKTNKVYVPSSYIELADTTNCLCLDLSKTLPENLKIIFDKARDLQPISFGFVMTNAFSVILSSRMMSCFERTKGSMRIPLDLSQPENLSTMVKAVAEAGYDSKVINAWGNYIICPTGHRDQLYTVVFQGNVISLGNYKIRNLEMIGAEHCLQGKTKTILDDAGRYLCAIEFYLAEEFVMVGNCDFKYYVYENIFSSIKWKINDELTITTPVSNVVFNAINKLDIFVSDKQ
jgi:hypothetical protein